MKIAFTSDTHLVMGYDGMTSEEQLAQMREDIMAEKPDLLIHGGDVGEVRVDLDNFSTALDILKIPGVDAAVIAGNHDLWSGIETSKELWSTLIPKMCEEAGWHYLEDSNWIKDGVAIVGSYLHYDYSAQDYAGVAVNHIQANFPDWTTDEYYERMKKRVVNDAKFFRGLPRDKEFAQIIGDAFRQRLMQAEQDDSVEHIIVATHVSCMPSQITRKPHNWHWSCATAYFGNLSHVEQIMKCSKVECVLSGHSHQANRELVERDGFDPIDVINLDSDYANPKFVIVETQNGV